MIARFQPFHYGHKSIIDQMLKDSNYTTIILGSSQESKTDKNPFSIEERKLFLKNIYGDQKNIKILSLTDLNDDNNWYKHVMNLVKKETNNFGFPDAYYCGSVYDSHWYDKGEFKIEIIDREKQEGLKNISATQIRNMIKNKDNSWKKYIPSKENVKIIENYYKTV